jgi:tRNA A-37 threonylcarbamoyl transferase component Bud32
VNAPLRESHELASNPAPGERIGEKYVVERVLGQGGAGVVYEAVHDYTGRRVAIKWVHPHVAVDATNAARFLREARAAAAVQHPNVVEILDAGRDRGTFYLVMERLEGEPLSAAIARGGLSPVAIARIFLSTLRGVAAAHALGIVHRDLKPDNVFLSRAENGRPGGAKVLDFGISKLKMQEGELTAAGVFVGSPYYMAPEQIADSRSVDVRADVYSVGVMLYESLSGRLPFDAESLSQLFAKVVSEKARPLDELRSDLPEGLSDLVARAMEPEPKERFATVRALATALESYADGMQFDPGGDAFEMAWKERATLIGEEFGWRDRPSTVVDELLAEPTRRADHDEILREAEARTGETDAASDAIASARARAARGDLPEQPTLIRPRDAAASPSRESSTDPSRSVPEVAERATVPPGQPLVPHATPERTPPPLMAPPPPLTGSASWVISDGRGDVTEVLSGRKAPAPSRARALAIGTAFALLFLLVFAAAFAVVRYQ